jgi:hypothetical protein
VRRPPRREEALAVAALSVAIGAGVAAVAFYAMRVLLARTPLGDPALLEAPRGPREGWDDESSG